MSTYPYPKEIKAVELDIRSTRNAIHNAWRQGRVVPEKTKRELRRLERRLSDMRTLFWIVTIKAWIK